MDNAYAETLSFYKDRIKKIKSDFDGRCEEIQRNAEEKIAKGDPRDKKNIKKIIEDEENELNGAIKEFENSISQNNREARKELERIEHESAGSPEETLKEMVKII